MKRLFVVLFVVTLALALSSCAPAPSSTGGAAATSAPAAPAAPAATTAPAAPAAGGTIKIGVQGPMTGDMAQEGLGFKNAVQLLVDQTNAAGGINGQQIELFVEDDRGDPKEASLVADRLISQGVIAVIGGYNSTATEPASAIYNKAGVLQITPGATAVRLSEHGYNQFFRTCFLDDKQAVFAADFLVKEMGYKNIAVLHDNTTYAQGLAEATKTSLEALGVPPVFYDAINPDDTDFSPTLTKLKALNPDAIYFTGYYAQGGLLLKQAKALGMTSQWTGGNAMNNTDLIKIAGIDNAKGFITTTEPLPNDLPYPEAKQFLADFKAKYNADPTSVFTVLAGDAFRVIQNAIEQTKSTDPAKLAEYLHKDFKEIPGISGPIAGFDERGDRKGTIHKAYVVDDAGNFVPFTK